MSPGNGISRAWLTTSSACTACSRRNLRSADVSIAHNTACLLASSATAPVADARITKIVLDSARSQSPTFGGLSFRAVGQYEKLPGTAYGELDPLDPRNAVITDIQLAPKNVN